MKLFTLLTAIAITSIALAHPDHTPEHPEHPSDHPEHPEQPSDAVDNDGAKEAEALLMKVHKVYKNADAIIETVTVTMPAMMPGEEPEQITLTSSIDANSGKISVQNELDAVWSDGTMKVTLEGMDESYIQTEAKTFSAGLDSALGGQGMPGMWTILLRESDKASDWYEAFSLGMPGVEVIGVTEDGDANIVEMKTMMGGVAIHVSADNTIDRVVMTIEQPGMPVMEMVAVAEVAFKDAMPAVSFDAGDRKKYDSLEAIFAEMDGGSGEEGGDEAGLIGKTAPDFTFATLEGGEVTLSDLKGEIVILDFWATWCGPCKLGLPLLNEFDAWAQKEGLNVKVFALNVWEGDDAAVVKATVSKFWKENKYTTAVLMGSGDEALPKNYNVKGIPATFVIGVDGKVLESHNGYDKNMVDTLKKSVTDALGGGDKQPDHPDHPDHPG